MARRLPWGSLPDGTILGFADAQRAAHRDMLESARQRQQLERRLSYEDEPVYAARLRGVIREMQPQLEQAGVDVQGALDDSFKYPPSPTRRDSDPLWNQIWATEEESPQTSAEDQGYQTASTCNTDGSPDASCTSGGSTSLDADMMLVDRPLPQHIFVPTWVYFARQRYSDLWKTILRHYFTHYRWPKFHTMPQWFIQACFNNGISPDKFERTPGFAPVWVFYMRDLVKDRVLDKEWFQYCITEFFNNGSFPNFEDMPDELQNMCAQDDISENDFVEVVEDEPVNAARLRGVIREMQPQLEQAGVDVQGALDDSFKYPPSPTRRDSDPLWNQIWATEEESPQTSAEDQGYQTASTCNTDGSPDASCTSGGSTSLDADMMLVDRPLPQHIFVPTWVYFARQRYSDLWKTILRHYFTHYRWPKFHTMPQWFIQACFNNGISPDKFERTPGFAPVWVFYMRDLVKDRVLDKEWFQYCITEFFNNGSFPNFEDMPDELQNMCAQDDISENDFVEVVGA